MFDHKEAQRVPNVTFRTRVGADWRNVTSDEIFAGKTVAVFSLPGAFTPTCSSSHVPRYNQLAPAFRKHGVDEIVCVSVNDAFVMNEWKKSQDAENITPHDLVNARISLSRVQGLGGSWTFAAWGKNLQDSDYEAFALDNLPQASRAVIWGDGRSYGLDITYRYE